VTAPAQWHFLTPEYPPEHGGVSDYTHLVANELAAHGEAVHVWAPCTGQPWEREDRVLVHRISGFGPRGLGELGRGLEALSGPRRLFIQYVPTAFGLGGMNIPLIRWLARRPEQIWVQFHEVALGWQLWRKPHHHLVQATQLWMASALARRAERLFVSIEGWLPRLGREASRATWLPIPSNLPLEVSEAERAKARETIGGGRWIAHFGTYGRGVTRELVPALQRVARENAEVKFLLLGRGAERVSGALPRERVLAPGELTAEAVAARLSVATLALQPFPDGISARRTSAMAALALGVPTVSTCGHLTDSVWNNETVALAPAGNPGALARRCLEVLADTQLREAIGRRGAQLYAQRFSLQRTLEALLPGAGATLPQHR